MSRIRRFIDEAVSELRKVTWPTREQVRNLTILVFLISGVMGVFITIFDIIFARVIGFLVGGQVSG